MEKPWGTGLGRYARGLVGALTALDAPDIEWVILKDPRLADTPLAAPGARAEERSLEGDPDMPANLGAGRAIDRLGLDLYHSLHQFLPLRLKTPRVVVTLHDLIWVEHARLSYYGRWAWARAFGVMIWGRFTMRNALRRPDHVIAISEVTRQASLRRYRFLKPDAVSVVHHGVDHTRFPARTGPEPEGAYLFSLGNSRPYKNVRNTVRAFAQIAPDHPEARLVMTGRGDSTTVLRALATELGVEAQVEFTGSVPDERVVELYQGARALVFPSRIEGFGFPLIEAMALGCPVIASDIPTLREIGGDSAVFVNPDGPDEIAAAMRRVLSEPDLRDDLRARGYAHAARFQWATCAERTLSVYRQLLL